MAYRCQTNRLMFAMTDMTNRGFLGNRMDRGETARNRDYPESESALSWMFNPTVVKNDARHGSPPSWPWRHQHPARRGDVESKDPPRSSGCHPGDPAAPTRGCDTRTVRVCTRTAQRPVFRLVDSHLSGLSRETGPSSHGQTQDRVADSGDLGGHRIDPMALGAGSIESPRHSRRTCERRNGTRCVGRPHTTASSFHGG